MPFTPVADYDAYREAVLAAVASGMDAGVFSAGVADYRPIRPLTGKIPSGQPLLRLELKPTAKVIAAVQAADAGLPIVSFKYLEGCSEAELLAVARSRLEGSTLVVANRGEEVQGQEQIAWLVSEGGEKRVEGKPAIAAAIAEHLEGVPSRRPPG